MRRRRAARKAASRPAAARAAGAAAAAGRGRGGGRYALRRESSSRARYGQYRGIDRGILPRGFAQRRVCGGDDERGGPALKFRTRRAISLARHIKTALDETRMLVVGPQVLL